MKGDNFPTFFANDIYMDEFGYYQENQTAGLVAEPDAGLCARYVPYELLSSRNEFHRHGISQKVTAVTSALKISCAEF